MHVHLFRKSRSLIKTFSTKVLFGALLAVTLLGNITTAFADEYDEYRTLFDTPNANLKPAGTYKSGIVSVQPSVQGSSGIDKERVYFFKVITSLVMDEAKDNSWKKEFYYDLVDAAYGGFGGQNAFLVRGRYTDATGKEIVTHNGMRAAYENNSEKKLLPWGTMYFYSDFGNFLSDDRLVQYQTLRFTPDFSKNPVPIGTKVTFDFWYCADPKSYTNLNPKNAPISETVQSFKQYITIGGDCSGSGKYFRIGEPIEYTVSADFDQVIADSQAPDPAAAMTGEKAKTTPDDPLPSCGVTKWIGCFAQIIYYVIFKPASWIAALLGNLFDFFIGYSVSDEAYRASFVIDAWRIVRDICNIFFIIILVYTGFATVFGIGKVSIKSIVPALIINALLINFSLFATRVVIDISNITARVFYSRIYVCSGDCEETDQKTGLPRNIKRDGPGGYWPISEAIVSSFDPQQLFTPETLQGNAGYDDSDETKDRVASDWSTSSARNMGATAEKSSTEYAGYFILVTLVSSFVIFGVAMMFWKVAFLFVSRVIGLYLSMVFSPFAFLSRNKDGKMPIVGSIPFISWDDWVKDITSYAMLAPVFTLFLYVIYKILQSDFLKSSTQIPGDGFFLTVLGLVIPMIITYFLISKGVDIAKKYSGSAGEKMQSVFSSATNIVGGAAIGLATGGAALAGRALIPKAAKAIGNGEIGRLATKFQSDTGWRGKLARRTQGALNGAQTASFDLRKASIGGQSIMNNKLFDRMGIKPDSRITNKIGLGEEKFKGGYAARQKELEKKTKERIESINLDDVSKEEAQKRWDARIASDAKAHADKNAEKQAVENYKKAQIERIQATGKTKEDAEKEVNGMSLSAIKGNAEFEKLKKDAHAQLLKDKEEKIKKDYGDIKSGKDLTKAMRRRYAEELRENSKYMKDGKRLPSFVWARNGLTGQIAASGAGIIAGAGFAATAGAGGIALGVMADRASAEQEAVDKATKDYIESYGKSKKKDDKMNEYKNKLKEIDVSLRHAIAAVTKKAFDDVNLENFSPEQQEKHLKDHLTEKRSELEMAEIEYDQAKKKYKKGDAASEKKFKEASKNKRELSDKVDELKKLWEKKESTEKSIATEEEKNKASEKKDEKKDEKK